MAAAAANVTPIRRSISTATRAALGGVDITALLAYLNGRAASLINDRLSFWAHWQEIAKYLIPRRYKWLVTPNQANRGSPINGAIIDSTGSIALRICAAGMMSGITSPGRPWFRMTLGDALLRDIPEVKAWLDEVTNRMLQVLSESNYYTSLATMYEDLASFGTHAMVIREDFEDVIRCYTFCLGEYCLANSARMQVNTCYRTFVMTVQQMVEDFGIEGVSDTVRALYEQTTGQALATEMIVAHAIEPNVNHTDKAGPLRGFPYREVYWEYGRQATKVLRISGLHEYALVAPRWSIVGNDAYGRGPGMDALGDIKQLQVETKRKAQAIDKMVNPPMVGDISMKNEPASLLPGAVTYANLSNDRAGFRPAYEVDPKIGELKDDIREVQNRIDRVFFVDIFMMLAQMDGKQPRNDLEIMERKEEKLIQLGPVLERLENECLDPSLNRVFNVMLRAGLFPPIPQALRGQFIKPEYISMLALAQKAAMTAGLERFASFVARVAAGQAGVQGVGPAAMDNVNWDEMCRQYGDLMGVPEKVVNAMAEVMKLREARAKEQQKAEMAQTLAAGVQGAKVLSETEVGGGMNALQAMAA